MDDKTTTKPTEAEQPPPDNHRGKSSSNCRDNSHDVLYLKGAAAQQTSHPGNLNFYALCEQRFDEWSALCYKHPQKKLISKEIVKVILHRGGVFRNARGGAMDIKSAVEKTTNRLRQIAAPKLRLHTDMYGENDVVFARGARNHMYPGNAKWRTLLDGYAQSYFRDKSRLYEGRQHYGFSKLNKAKPKYMTDIVEETISIIEKRGGKFLDETLWPLSYNDIVRKTHARFKDMKREIKAGKLVLSATKEASKEDTPSGEIEDTAVDTSATVKAPKRELVTPGFTSVKATMTKKEVRKKMKKNQKRKEKKFYGNQYKSADGEVELNDISMPSIPSDEGELEDNDNDADDNDDEGKEEEKEFKDLSRHERRMRRESGQPAPQPPQKQTKPETVKKRKRTDRIEQERARSPSPEHTLSEYEQMRLAKIERNQKRLKDLGLS
mmetsp:Transcript_21739/g.34096  ORF Transcript_21739/g.34096 Transcript_21739/m.34096 type:complete len:437 (-) Transcript_21739:95-1405(-)